MECGWLLLKICFRGGPAVTMDDFEGTVVVDCLLVQIAAGGCAGTDR